VRVGIGLRLLILRSLLVAVGLGVGTRPAKLLAEFGIGDRRRGFDVGGGDDGGRGFGGVERGAIGHAARDTEELEQIVELAVDVTADGDRGGDRLDIGF
jgi:hypothetical protein